jgi:hypothetical protein
MPRLGTAANAHARAGTGREGESGISASLVWTSAGWSAATERDREEMRVWRE